MLHFTAQGYYSWAVLNERDRIVRASSSYEKNLILDQGLNGIAVRSWADSFTACAVGTGTSSPLPSDIGLASEVRRTNTYLDLQSANSSTLSVDLFTLRRTFVFPKESNLITYTEAGFGYSMAANSLFSRIKLPNVQVSANERLIIQYELAIKVSPIVLTALKNPLIVKGKDTSGSFQYQYLGLKGVNSSGQSYNYDISEGCNEPSSAAKGFFSTVSTAPATFGSAIDRSGTIYETDVSLSPYINGSFSRTKIFSATKKNGIGTWRSVGLGANSGSSFTKTGLVHVFNSAIQKGQGQFDVGFTFTWNRFSFNKPSTLYYWQDEDALMLRRKKNLLLDYFGQSDE